MACKSISGQVLVVTGNPWCPLQWRHKERDGVSNHKLPDCLLNCLFRRRSKKTPKLRVPGLCAGNSPVTGEFSAHKGPVTRKMFPFDDVIMSWCWNIPEKRGRHHTWNIAISTKCYSLPGCIQSCQDDNFDEIFVTGYIGSCQWQANGNFRSSQWQKCRQNYISVSVTLQNLHNAMQ